MCRSQPPPAYACGAPAVEITNTPISAIKGIVAIIVVIRYSVTKGSIIGAPFYNQSSAYRFVSSINIVSIWI